MFNSILIIAIGGALGAVSRHCSSIFFESYVPGKPFISTLVVNVTGSILIGGFYLLADYYDIKDTVKLFFVVGFLGSLTTFSTFSFDFVNMINQRTYFLAASYLLLNLCISCIFIFIFLKYIRA
ncbi:MAG: CrcB family protein [Thermodesulfobacteriota bacteirum]|mgnify:FL=1|nr:CrcB family protein [Thermodesulfobacteriota bacterium]